jgi:hypothetical protein
VPKLSEQSKAMMFTCEPGSELYAGFGHSALWVSDPSMGVDRLYNYGTFDFNTPHFYWLFIRGKLEYMLTVTSARRFIDEYNYRKVGVTGQTLNLKLNEKQRLFELLETNLLPENRFYKYDFFYDNCATRIRDVVINASDGEIDFNTADQNVSFRQLLFPYLVHTPWTKFGINLILGLSSDIKATPIDYMFLPEHMQQQFNNATKISTGQSSKLVSSEVRYLDSGLEFSYNLLNDPALLFGLMFMLTGAVTLVELRRKRYLKWLDIILNSVAVVAGLFLLFMWLGTDHIATNYNLNILWLLPAQAVFMVSVFVKKVAFKYQLVSASFFIIATVTFAMFFWPQETELSFFIIAFIYALRYLFHKRINMIVK